MVLKYVGRSAAVGREVSEFTLIDCGGFVVTVIVSTGCDLDRKRPGQIVGTKDKRQAFRDCGWHITERNERTQHEHRAQNTYPLLASFGHFRDLLLSSFA
jgi:hypothetical protein